MKQGSGSWLEWRRNGIGSSDAPIIMGVSPWNTPYGLYEEKAGLVEVKDEPNFAMARGIELEPKARAHYELMSDIDMPPVCIEHGKYPFLRASLDGFNSNTKRILEIKCPGKEDHETALSGKVPEKYIWQLRHQLAVAEADQVDYFSFDGERGVVVPFYRDLEEEKKLLEAELAFWEMVQSKKPPEMTERDFHKPRDKELSDLCKQWSQLYTLEKDLSVKLEAIREQIIAKTTHARTLCGGVKVVKFSQKGNVNYKAIPELKGIDLEQYRGKPIQKTIVSLAEAEEQQG